MSTMREPENHIALVDRFGGTWVRVDDCPGRNGDAWWPITDGPGFEQWAQDGVGQSRDWLQVEDYGPFTAADLQLTLRAVDLVRREDD